MADGGSGDEDALQVSESRLRALVDAVSTGVWRTDDQGRLQTDMPAWRERTRQHPEELAGLGWLEGVHPEDRARVELEWGEAVATDSRFAMTYRVRPVRGPDPEAAVRWFDVSGAPVRRGGRTVEWFGMYDDVTQLHESQAARERLRRLADTAAERTRALQEVTSALSGALRASDVLTKILANGRRCTGADGSGVALVEGDQVRYHQLDGYGSDVLASWGTFSTETCSPVPYVLRTGEPLFLATGEEILALFDVAPIRAFLQSSGEQAMARLPLRTSSGVIGVLTLGFLEPHVFEPDERAFLVALANQCAQALERARLYEREREHAQVLQRSLLPAALPEPAGLRLAARCTPATADTEIGGDWYDALELPDGRLGVVVGDVMGKGIRAAAVMGQVRNALRGLVHADPSPAAVLSRLDRLVAAMDGDEEMVTLVYGVIDGADGTFVWSAAGHPPPLVLSDGGRARFAEHRELLPLGLGGAREEQRLRLRAGESVLLYSDGLVENRVRPLLEGLPLLRCRAGSLRGRGLAPQPLVEALVEAMTGPPDGVQGPDRRDDDVASRRDDDVASRRDDDVTVLLVAREDAQAPARTRHQLTLAARPASAGAARRFVREHLLAAGEEELSDDAQLCVSEVVTNALLHAGSTAVLGLRVDHDVVRFEVVDSGRGFALPDGRPADTRTGGRGLMIVGAVASRWGVQENGDSKTVWFELTRAAAVAAAP